MHEIDDFFDLEKVKARVYLLKEGNPRDTMMVTGEKLMVIRKGERQVYQLSGISSVSTGNKKLLLPLILGAIMAPFAFTSSFTNVFPPLVHLIFTLLGLLLFFIGWAGMAVLSINFEDGGEEFFFLPSISKNLQAFIEYLNAHLKGRADIAHLIFIENNTDTEEWLYEKNHDTDRFPVFGYTYLQIIKSRSSIGRLVAIDPRLAGIEIKFEYNENLRMMRPKINGPIDKNSIIHVEV